jgi:hypothetical protein
MSSQYCAVYQGLWIYSCLSPSPEGNAFSCFRSIAIVAKLFLISLGLELQSPYIWCHVIQSILMKESFNHIPHKYHYSIRSHKHIQQPNTLDSSKIVKLAWHGDAHNVVACGAISMPGIKLLDACHRYINFYIFSLLYRPYLTNDSFILTLQKLYRFHWRIKSIIIKF